MKKLVTILLSLMIICTLPLVSRTTANAATSGDFEYYINYDGNIVISRYIGSGGDVVVPSEIDGQPVFALGGETFRYSDGAINVTISEGIEQIFEWAFYSAGDVETVYIPSSVTNIEPSAFMVCQKLKQITVSTSNMNYTSDDGVLFTKDMAHIMQYPISHTSDVYMIPDGVKYIDEQAFRTCKLRHITIPDSVLEIGYGAFSESWIEELNIPDGVTKIGDHAFTYLNNVVSISIPKSVTSIGQRAFQYCTSLPSFYVDDANTSYISVDGVIFNKSKTELLYYPMANPRTGYEIPGTVISIADAALDGARNLQKITIPSSISSIGSSVFHWCFDLEEINVSEQNLNYTSQGGVLFNKDMSKIILYPPSKKDKLYSIPESVYEIEIRAFCDCHNLTHVILSSNITEISAFAFSDCSNLSKIIIPNGIEIINNYAFQDCMRLKSIVIPSSVKNIYSLAFEQCLNLEKVFFLGDAPTLSNNVFVDCHDDLTIYYPKNAIGYANPWNGYPTVSLDASELPELDVQEYGNINGFTYWIKDSETTIVDYTGNDSSVAIPPSIGGYPVKIIGTIAFKNNPTITSLNIPIGLNEISAAAFYSCSELRQISIPESVNLIGEFAFTDCIMLENIVLPSNLSILERYVFFGCSSLESIDIPEGITIIGVYAFGHCRLTSVTIPSSVNMIESSAFLGCYTLSRVLFNGDAPYIDDDPSISQPFDFCADDLIIYYTSGSTGFTNPWHGYPTKPYDPNSLIGSTKYSIDRDENVIFDIPINTSVSQLKANLVNDSSNLKILTSSDIEYNGSDVATGMTIKLIMGNETKDELKIVIFGDVSGDGVISITDYTLARLDILNLKPLTGEYEIAADANRDGVISITDYTLIRLDILDLKKIH